MGFGFKNFPTTEFYAIYCTLLKIDYMKYKRR